MYTPRGGGTSELGDIEVVADGDDLHLFHLTLPNHDVIQHAVSQDGLSWQALPAALRTGDPGDCDGDQIWTMSVTPRLEPEPGYVMLYTALSCADRGQVQRVAMATSDDLMTWTKSPRNPVAEADPRWYENDPALTGSVSFRDPKPVRTPEGYLATVCARTRDGVLPRRGCAGLLRSDDLETWEVCPPLFAPDRYWDLECPQLFQLGEADGDVARRWYLIAAIMEDRSQRYWVAKSAHGPFGCPPGSNQLAPAGHYAARVVRWRGMDLLFAWHQPALAQGWQSRPDTVDWVAARNPFGKFLAPPLALRSRADGGLALNSFPGWSSYQDEWTVAGADGSIASQRPGALGGLSVRAAGGMELAAIGGIGGDSVMEGWLSLSGARGGLALRLDDAGSGLYVEVIPGSRSVRLERWGVRRDERDGSLRPDFAVLQEAERHEPLLDTGEIQIRVMTVGPYVEVSLDGEVAIAHMTGTPAAGRWGLWVEDGASTLREARTAAMRRPGEDESSRG